jgi:hypothetical protein
MATSLWQLADLGRTLRCELFQDADGRYCLRVVKSQERLPLLEQEFTDRPAALAVGIGLYRGFKDAGWRDPAPTHQAVTLSWSTRYRMT